MLSTMLTACVLVAVTVGVHAGGISVLLKALRRWFASPPTGFWPIARLLVVTTLCLILLHLAEIGIWGLFYLWQRCMPDAEAALYFSGVTYTSIGFGDLVLSKPWRMLAPIEGLTGILMCGLSTGLFFALVSRIYQSRLAPTS